MCQLILAIVAAMIIAVAVAAVYLPWWAPVALVFIFLFGTRYLFRTVLGGIAKGAAAAVRPQGEILHNAKLDVHSITPAAVPIPRPDEFGDRQDPEKKKADYASRKWFELLLTIAPTKVGAQKPEWEPRELKLIVENPKLGDTQVDDKSCVIHQVDVEKDGAFQPVVGDDDLHGAHKLKMLIGVRPGVERLRFNYFFNLFGEIKIPK